MKTNQAPSTPRQRLLLGLVVAESALDEVIDELRQSGPSEAHEEYDLSIARRFIIAALEAAGRLHQGSQIERLLPVAERRLNDLITTEKP